MGVRLQKFLPVVLLALVMQVLAPIAACWAAGQAVADPLGASAICHSVGEQGAPGDQGGSPIAHSGACALCCLVQANASLDPPPHAALSVPFRHAKRVVWRNTTGSIVTSHGGSNVQARAPPHLT